MAVAIRLARQGAKKRPFYRIVAADKSAPRDGRFIEQIGYYDPLKKSVHLDRDRYDRWLATGAQPSDTVKHLAKVASKSAAAA